MQTQFYKKEIALYINTFSCIGTCLLHLRPHNKVIRDPKAVSCAREAVQDARIDAFWQGVA